LSFVYNVALLVLLGRFCVMFGVGVYFNSVAVT